MTSILDAYYATIPVSPPPALPIALVGALGAPTLQGNGTSPLTPTWGTGATRTAGNLLICWASNQGTTAVPATPAGWSLAASVVGTGGTFASGAIFYAIATGSDAAPTLTANRVYAQLGEFTYNASTPLDQSAGTNLSSSPQTVTNPAADASSGELVVFLGSAHFSSAGTSSISATQNNVASTSFGGSGYAALADAFCFGYGISNANATPDSATFTFSGNGGAVGSVGMLASFKHG